MLLTVDEPAAILGWLESLPAMSRVAARLLLGDDLLMADSPRVTRTQIQPAVVTLPAEIDLTNARHLGGELGAALTCGAAVVVADMTATVFCDSCGVRILVLAGEQAAATGIELRLVVPSTTVRRTLALMGLDGLLPIYRRLNTALTAP